MVVLSKQPAPGNLPFLCPLRRKKYTTTGLSFLVNTVLGWILVKDLHKPHIKPIILEEQSFHVRNCKIIFTDIMICLCGSEIELRCSKSKIT